MYTKKHVDKSFVNPSEYPAERLERERLALVKCVRNKPFINYRDEVFYPVIGQYYTAVGISSDTINPRYRDELVLTQGKVLGHSYPVYDFSVVLDPGEYLLSPERNLGRNIYLWRQAKNSAVDKSQNMVSDEWLTEHSLALVQYPADSKPVGRLKPGKQYYAVFLCCDDIVVYEGSEDEKPFLINYDMLDILSDPLGILDYGRRGFDEVYGMQKQIHSDLFPNARKKANKGKIGKILSSINKRLDREVFSQLGLSAEVIEKIKAGYERIIVDALKEEKI